MKISSHTRAVVTGAGSGFGAALARCLVAKGAHVLLSDVDDARGEQVTRALQAMGSGVVAEYLHCDVARLDDIERLARVADEKFGGTDLLVNNAGLAVVGAFEDVPLRDFELEVNVNLWGVIHGCRVFLPGMKRRGSGAILNVASAAGLVSLPLMGPYNVTKAAVISLSETIHAETLGTGVTCTVVCPTFFRTNLHRSARAPEPLRRAAEMRIAGSKWSADEIAERALRGVARGDLYVLPQAEAKVLWALKKMLGRLFYRAIHLSGVVPKADRL